MKTVAEMKVRACKAEYDYRIKTYNCSDYVPAEYAQQLWDRVKDLENQVGNLKIEAAGTAVEREASEKLMDMVGSLRQQLDEAKEQLLSLAASEAQLRKALEAFHIECEVNGNCYPENRCSACLVLSIRPSEALRPWVEFVKAVGHQGVEISMTRATEATQLLSSINFPGA